MSKRRNGYSGKRYQQRSMKGKCKVKKIGDCYLHPTKGFRPIPWQERRG